MTVFLRPYKNEESLRLIGILGQKEGGLDNCITIVPTNDPTTADWQSYWGSLTFAVR